MKKIGFTLNEVFRQHLQQLAYTYNKFVDEDAEIDLEKTEVTDYDYENTFVFDGGKEEYKKFLYEHMSLPIFGHADLTDKISVPKLNEFIVKGKEFGDYEVIIKSKEYNLSIPSTFFFLSKTAFKADKYIFEMDEIDIWNDLDILITASPVLLDNKPEDKVSIKIKTTYNEESEADYTYDSVMDFFADTETINELIKNK